MPQLSSRLWPSTEVSGSSPCGEPSSPVSGLAAAPAGPQHYNVLHMLRGLAALWVVLFHIHTFSVTAAFEAAWPKLLYLTLFDFGRGGVAIFFVLSGFVIAHSLSGKAVDARYFAQFFIRRSLRLEPSYFVSIMLCLSVTAAYAIRHGQEPLTVSFGDILAHMLYLQELLQIEAISAVYWTLTYELQFYLVYAGVLAIQHWLGRNSGNKWSVAALDLLMVIVALAGALLGPGWATHGLFLNFWYAFYLGVAVRRAATSKSSRVTVMLLAVLMLATSGSTDEVFNSPAALTGLSLLVLTLANRLNVSSAPRPLMLLGTISYSLYLTHYPVLLVALSVSSSLRAPSDAFGTWLTLGLELGLALGTALLFWWAVERPSQAWSKAFGSNARSKVKTVGEAEAS